MAGRVEIPFHRPSIGPEEIDEVRRTLESGWLTTGPRTADFERAFRTYVGSPYAQAVNSCTAGLHLALVAMGIGPGMEVITTPLTFCATVNVILHVGATPVLADVGDDGNIDPGSVASRVTGKTRAIIAVHLAGLPSDMGRLREIARSHHLWLLEDAAHGAGAQYQGQRIGGGNPAQGTASDAAAFSFYATKNMTTGEGGMVTTHSEAIFKRIQLLCLHGLSHSAWNRYGTGGGWYYDVLLPGFKCNLSDIQSAIGLHQLRKLEDFIAVRARYARLYNELLRDTEAFELPPDKADCRHAWHLYTLRLNLEKLTIDRDAFIARLQEAGIGTSVHFIPIPLHSFFRQHAQRPANQCPRALALYPRLVSLPLYPAMTEGQVEYVAETTKKVARRHRRKMTFAAADGR